MTSFDTLQSISSRLNELTILLSTSKLSKEELVEFETLSRKLYERALILNYKAKEERVYGKTSDKVANPILPFSNEEDEVKSTENVTPIAENYMEAIVEQHEIVEEEEEDEFQEEMLQENEEIIEEDSDSYEETTPEKVVVEDDGRVQFDFSGGFDTAKVEEKPEPGLVAENQDFIKEESTNEMVEEIEVEEPKVEERKVVTPEPSIQKGEPIEEKIHEYISQESIAQEEPVIQEKASPSLDEMLHGNDKKTASFYARFSKANKEAVGDRLGTSKIHTLKGAIGLNDRMLFINELFNGDSACFNEAIDNLDQLENNEVALRKLSEIAAREGWNNDDASVDEFAHLITRRYVE